MLSKQSKLCLTPAGFLQGLLAGFPFTQLSVRFVGTPVILEGLPKKRSLVLRDWEQTDIHTTPA